MWRGSGHRWYIMDVYQRRFDADLGRHTGRRVGAAHRFEPHAELIRQAVSGFLSENKAGLENSFGLWKKRAVDGVEYQEQLRNEWER